MCVHCDAEEAAVVDRAGGKQWSAGYCTKAGNWFHGKRVPIWMKGCHDWQLIPPSWPKLTRQEQLEGLADQGIDTLEDYRMEK